MAPHLRLDQWARLYEPDGLMSLYWRRLPLRGSHPLEGWVYCETEDAVEALRMLVQGYPITGHGGHGVGQPVEFPVTQWELAWFDHGEMTVIAASDSIEHWRQLLRLAGEI